METFWRQALRLNNAENALECLPGALLGSRREFFGRDPAESAAIADSDGDLVLRLQPAMVKIRKSNLRGGFVRRFFRVQLPVRFRSGKIKLLLVFERAQRIQFRISGLLVGSVSPSAGRVSAGGLRKSTSPYGMRHRRGKKRAPIASLLRCCRIQAGRAPCVGAPPRGNNAARPQRCDRGFGREITERFQGPPPVSRCCVRCLRAVTVSL